MQNLEQVILVDEHDHEIGTEEKITAHRKALLHRAFSIFIFREHNGQIELLLQKRHQDKYHCGGLWTNSVCSHPRPNESLQMAAERRLQEELGITLPVQLVGSFIYKAEFDNGLTEHEYDHVFIGQYRAGKFLIDEDEVEAIAWTSVSELQLDLVANPSKYTPWLQQALQLALSK